MDLTQCLVSIPRRSTILQNVNPQSSISCGSFNFKRLDKKPASCVRRRVDLSLPFALYLTLIITGVLDSTSN